MALPKPEPGFACVLEDVPITGTEYAVVYDRLQKARVDLTGKRLLLRRDRDNPHDSNAVRVLTVPGMEIGWVGRRTGHSQKVGHLMDQPTWDSGYLLVTHHDQNGDPMTRLRGNLYMKRRTAAPADVPKLAGPIVSKIHPAYSGGGGLAPGDVLRHYPGKLLNLTSNAARTSVSLVTGDEDRVAWFRKSDLPDWEKLANKGLVALVVGPGSVMLITPQQAQQFGYEFAMMNSTADQRFVGGIDVADVPIGSFDTTTDFFNTNLGQAFEVSGYQAPEPTQTQPPKETAMSKIAQTATAIITANKSAAATAGYMEAGRLANNQAAKLASKHLPFMLKAYADTPLGKLVIANIAQAAVKQLRPNDATLNELTDAMIVQAFQALYQTVDLDGILDSLTSSPEMQRAISKVRTSDEA